MKALFLLFLWPVLAMAQPSSQPLQKIVCGDGLLDAGESCDDGNIQDGDGCSSTCLEELRLPPSTSPVTGTSASKEEVSEGSSLVNPVVGGGPYYRNPQVALWLSAAPTMASFAALTTTFIYRGVTQEQASTALALSLVSTSISPSIGMLYAKNPKLAFSLMGGRGLASGVLALGLALHREDPEDEDEFDNKLIGGGLSALAIFAITEILFAPEAAKQSYPKGGEKPATIIKQ